MTSASRAYVLAHPQVLLAPTIETLAAALDDYARGRWRPIESAPRDGSDFLALVLWQKKHHQMVGCFTPDNRFVSWPGRYVYQPTHWMPLLPAPPEDKP